jgi:altronate dehydratase
MAAQSSALPVTVTAIVNNGACTYRGFWIASTAGADVVIYDGTTAAGTILAQFTLAAKGSMSADVADGVRCTTGIYISASAAVQGHVRVG